jgi:hypothetical protein
VPQVVEISIRNVFLADICQWLDSAGPPPNFHHFSAEFFFYYIRKYRNETVPNDKIFIQDS